MKQEEKTERGIKRKIPILSPVSESQNYLDRDIEKIDNGDN